MKGDLPYSLWRQIKHRKRKGPRPEVIRTPRYTYVLGLEEEKQDETIQDDQRPKE